MTEEKYLSPDEIYGEELQPWQDLWDQELSLFENTQRIASQSVLLPNQSIQLPIAVIYILTSSKWAKVLPILFSWGDKGTGKTTFAILASKIHGFRHVFSPADTFASIRNALDLMRWIDPEDKEYEKDGAILCWDNLHRETLLNDPRIYQLLLFGYNKSTERIQIAGADGTNREYLVFCPKIISSVHPLHADLNFEELQRRLMVIRHKQFEKFQAYEIDPSAQGFTMTNKIDLDAIYWNGIENQFFEFWNNEDNCKLYVRYRTSLTRSGKKKLELPPSITGERWTVSIDMLTTGLVLGAWKTIQEGIDALGKYWELANEFTEGQSLNVLLLLREYIDGEVQQTKLANDALVASGCSPHPVEIRTYSLKRYLEGKAGEGCVDIPVQTKNIAELMRKLGFTLKGDKYVEMK